MKDALKEWNTIVEALGQGHIIAVWRKGGIGDSPSVKEPFENFQVEKKQFILFPTTTHQSSEKIRNQFHPLLEDKCLTGKDNQVRIKYWAELEEAIDIPELEKLLNVSNELVNNNEHLISSWNLYPNHYGKLLILRVYQYSDPILVTNSLEYQGCKSWVELKIDIPKIGSKPAMQFKDFSQRVKSLKKLLSGTLVASKVNRASITTSLS